MSARMKAQWAARRDDMAAAIRHGSRTPEYRRLAAERAKANWADPEFRARQAARRATPAYKAKMSAARTAAPVAAVRPNAAQLGARTRKARADRERRSVLDRARVARRARMADGCLATDFALTYRCQNGHVETYIRSAGTPWSEVAAPCYTCPVSTWLTTLTWPDEHPTRANEHEHVERPQMLPRIGLLAG